MSLDPRKGVNDNAKVIEDIRKEFENVNNESKASAKNVKIFEDSIKKYSDQAKLHHDKISELFQILLVDEGATEGKDPKKSIKTKIFELEKNAQDIHAESKKINDVTKKDFLVLKNSLEKEIRELLPSASAASLAGTYYNAKRKYSDKYSAFFLYVLFLAPLVYAGAYFYKNPLEVATVGEFITHLVNVSPIIAVASFGAWSIRLYRRLYEEYSHKQCVMELYDGFKKQIDQNGTKEQKQALISIMLETVGHKPSLAMSKYDHMNQLETVSIWGLLKMFLAKCISKEKEEEDVKSPTSSASSSKSA